MPATLLLVLGGALALIGGIGLLRLPDFYQRMHAPTLSNTLGCGSAIRNDGTYAFDGDFLVVIGADWKS